MFLDKHFGSHPEDYVYELDAATGEVISRRPLKLASPIRTGKMDIQIESANLCILNEDSARLLVDVILEDLLSVPARSVSACAD